MELTVERPMSRRAERRLQSLLRDLVLSGLPVLLAAAFLGAAFVSPAKTVPAVDNPRTRLLATYLIPPTYIPILALFAPQGYLLQLAPPYLTATYGTPPQPVTEVDYPAALLSSTSIRQGLTALQSDVAGDPAPVIFGYSQGAEVLSVYKQAFNAQYATSAPGTTVPTPTYVVIGSPSRPNGGLSTRLSFLGIPAIGGTSADAIPTPTETAGAAPGQITTYDFVHQYEFFADFPNRPLNVLAFVNAVMGVFEHATYGQVNPSEAVLQQRVGDTAYYLRPTPVLPLLQPFAAIGIPQPIIAALDAPLRVLVEAGYDRTISPGTPTAAQLLPVANPIQTAINFAVAIPTGLDDAFQLMGHGRPFGTTPAGPYGVGGPPVTLPGNTSSTLASTAETSAATPAPLTRAAAAVSTSDAKPFSCDCATESTPVSHLKRSSAAHEKGTAADDHLGHGATTTTGSTEVDTASSGTTPNSTNDDATQTTSSSSADSLSAPGVPTGTHRSDTDATGKQPAPPKADANKTDAKESAEPASP